MRAPNWFIGLPVLPDSWFDGLPEAPPSVRVFAQEDLHITVAFLGPVTGEAADRAFALAPRWPLGPLEVVLGQVEALGRARRPSAFGALLREPQAVAGAIAAVRPGMLEAAGGRPDPRFPKPHVTLARPRRRASEAERARARRWAEAIHLGDPRIVLDRLALYTWSRDRAVRQFDRIAEQVLA